jgi:hypothetical protein
MQNHPAFASADDSLDDSLPADIRPGDFSIFSIMGENLKTIGMVLRGFAGSSRLAVDNFDQAWSYPSVLLQVSETPSFAS